MKRNDKGLVSRIKLGDKRAFEELVHRYQKKVFMIAFGILKNEDDAYDAAQEVFMKVYKYINKFQENSSIYTWIYRIAYNVSVDLYRKRKNERAVEYGELVKTDQYTESVHHKVKGPTDYTQNNELSAQIKKGLDQLSDEHRTILVLREFEGLSYDEISDVMDVPKGTVMSRLYHARLNLKKTLKNYL